MENDELFKWLSPILVGLISAALASFLALRKFKKEKVWDERRSAYKEVIESVEELIYWSEQVRANYFCEPVIGVQANFDKSIRKISKFSATGSFIFSEKFHETLKQANLKIKRLMFEIEEDSKPDLGSEAEMASWKLALAKGIREVLEESLPTLIKLANKDKT
ncbi:hypothetical protein [Shewanella insulae]|uniref:hypothetical protein n=1 Tax=Shewanella insulae TaxID=2681496 RepID=UPI00248178BA|nr:hypothetical protein [Shewanella insulae]